MKRLVEVILCLVVVEWVGLVWARRSGRITRSPTALACNLGAGAALLLALRQQISRPDAPTILALLGMSFMFHLADLRSR